MIDQKARSETIKYHEEYYGKHALFEKGSWLEKPDQLTMDLIVDWRSEKRSGLKILDLGAGVGRNSVPLALELKDLHAEITCVDFLQTAIDKLLENARQHAVEDCIVGKQSDFETLCIREEHYDLILAVSVLEHCSCFEGITGVIDGIISGTKSGGYNRLEFTTNRNVRDQKTGEQIPTFVETPLESEILIAMLKDKYKSWQIQKLELTPYEEVLEREGRKILWKSMQLNIVTQKI